MVVAHGRVIGCVTFTLHPPDEQRSGAVVMASSCKFIVFAVVFIVTVSPLVSPAPTKILPPFVLGICITLWVEVFAYCVDGTEPFRSRANSLPGANRPIGLWPIRSLANSLPGPFVPWPFRSLELLLRGPFAPDG